MKVRLKGCSGYSEGDFKDFDFSTVLQAEPYGCTGALITGKELTSHGCIDSGGSDPWKPGVEYCFLGSSFEIIEGTDEGTSEEEIGNEG